MAWDNPSWMQNLPYSARVDRQLVAAMFGEGILNGLEVTQRGAGANASVDIQIGRAVIYGDDQANQNAYLGNHISVTNLVGFAAAPATGERFDLVYARVNDPNAGGPAGNNFTFGIVTGTAAAVGVATIPALPTSAIPLATVRWTPGVGSVTNSMIVSRRVVATAFGGDPIGASTEFTVPEQYIDTRYVIEDGRAISRTVYAAYFAMVGTMYGTGDGSTTFNVRDKRGRMSVGSDNMGGTAANRVTGLALGGSGGASSKTLSLAETPVHSHVVNSHSHGGSTGGQSQSHLHDLQNHAHYTSGGTDGQGTHHHDTPLPYYAAGFDGALDLSDGGATSGYRISNLDDDGFHGHNWGGWSGGPNINNTGWTDRDHSHGIGAESPGTSTAGSGNGFSIMNPYIGANFAVRVV